MSEPESSSNRVAILETRWGAIVETLDEIKQMLASVSRELKRLDHHDYKVSALETRVLAIELAREDEKKNGGLLGWAKNVGAVFGAFLAVAGVVSLVITVGMLVRGAQ